uniref:Uncharacterized protein n=1 Tax=Guillardia theta (strain CCMP2712) TaxID=905079 RepID=A0A0C3U3X2_GUITC
MSWQDELMCIECRHLKNQDQSNQARDSYRICANPLMPEICPFLALGIYFLSYTPDEQKLFPGSHQYHRFLAGLQRVLTPDESS